MYRLLIVDDERYIVESLSELFAAQHEPEYDILTSYYGDEALDILQTQRVDIVLLDINMPGLSGIEVAGKINASWPMCRIIFLTGYASFDYIYQIKQMIHTSFILKTEDNETIIQTVHGAAKEIEKEREVHQMEYQSHRNAIYLQYLLHAEILSNFLHDRQLHGLLGEIQKNAAHFQFNINAPVSLFYMKIKWKPDAHRQTDFHQLLVDLTLDFHQDLNGKYHISLVDTDAETITAFLQPADPLFPDAGIAQSIYMRECLNDRISALSDQSFCQVFLILLEESVIWSQLGKTFDALSHYYTSVLPQFPQYGRILTVNLKDLTASGNVTELFRSSYPKDAVQELSLNLHGGNREGISKYLVQISDYLEELQSMHHLNGVRLYHEVSAVFLEYLTQYHLEEKAALKIGLYKLYNINQFGSWKEVISYYHKLSDIIIKIAQTETFSIKEQTLNQIRRYIHENLDKNLTLNQLANYANYNSSYMSRYFKQMTGESISQYVMRTKMDYAKQYLSSSNMSIQQIGEKLGFDSSQYFSLVFKKYTGISPRAYRSNEAADENGTDKKE